MAPQPVLQAIQLGTADNSIRFRAKTVGVVEQALGVDKEVTSATSAWPQGHVWPDVCCDRRNAGRLALTGRVAPGQLGQHRVVGRQLGVVVAVGRAIQSPRGSLIAA